ncbi:hypothetical protein Tco_1065854 [Tanacetum coccineum]
MSSMRELTFFLGLQVQQKKDGIFISQDKYVDEILRKFNYTDVKSASTLVDLEKPLVKDGDATDVDELFQVTPKTSHLLAVKRIFRYLKGKPTLGLWLISWQCKKQTVVATSTTEAEYMATTSFCRQVLWIQNQLLDYRKIMLIRMNERTSDKSVKQIGKSKEVGTLRYLSLVVPLRKVSDKAVHKELGDRMERVATTASSLEAEQDSGSEGFHQIIDFLSANHIQYALIENLTIYVSFIKQFRRIATARTSANREVELTATIDGQEKTITEASLKRHLKLEDNCGVTTLPNSEIFKQLALIGAPETSPSEITSSPSLSPQHTPVTIPSTSQPPNTQPTLDTEEPTMPYDSPLQSVYSLEHDEGSIQQHELTNLVTKLIDRVAVLENDLQQTKKTYSTAITKLILRDEDVAEDSSKQGRKIFDIDQDPTISLVQDEEMTWFQEDTEIQEDADIQIRTSNDTEVLLEEEEPTELVEDLGSGEKGEKDVSTANLPISTASATLEVSTTAGRIVYIRRNAEKRKDKGKAIMKEDESVQKKDAEIAKQLQEEINTVRQEKAVTEDDQSHDIDWSDPAVIRYHTLQNRPRSVAEVRKNMCIYLKKQGGYKMKHFKGMSYEDIRPIFEKVWDEIHSFVPMVSELELHILKRAGQDVEEEPAKRQRTEEASGSVQKQTDEEPKNR